jgi:hypothetical protein
MKIVLDTKDLLDARGHCLLSPIRVRLLNLRYFRRNLSCRRVSTTPHENS